MIIDSDIIQVVVSGAELSFIKRMANLSELGGNSAVRPAESRKKNLKIDQVVGQLGAYAGSKFFFGDARDFRISRWYANKNKWSGDGGSDVTGANIDFKTSLVRNKNKDLLTYNLLVRPKEFHKNWVYVLLLVTSLSEASATVSIVGWATDKMLGTVEKTGMFAGAHVLSARDLNPLPPIRWWADDVEIDDSLDNQFDGVEDRRIVLGKK